MARAMRKLEGVLGRVLDEDFSMIIERAKVSMTIERPAPIWPLSLSLLNSLPNSVRPLPRPKLSAYRCETFDTNLS